MLNFLNPHLIIHKRSRHFPLESTPTSLIEEENPNVVHLDEDVLKPNSHVKDTPTSPMYVEFVTFLQPHTKRQKAKSVQRMLWPSTQTVVQLDE